MDMRKIINEVNWGFGLRKQQPEPAQEPEDLSNTPYQMGDRSVTGDQILGARDVTNKLNDITKELDTILRIIERNNLDQLDSKSVLRWKNQIHRLYREMHLTWFGEPHDSMKSHRYRGELPIDDYLDDHWDGKRP